MPTYEYECKICSHTFEAFQSMSDEPLKQCPECGKEIRRLIFGGAGVIFKGSGFYVTDKNKDSSSGKKPPKKSAESPPKDSGSDGSKPASGNSGCGACPETKCPAAAAAKESGKRKTA